MKKARLSLLAANAIANTVEGIGVSTERIASSKHIIGNTTKEYNYETSLEDSMPKNNNGIKGVSIYGCKRHK